MSVIISYTGYNKYYSIRDKQMNCLLKILILLPPPIFFLSLDTFLWFIQIYSCTGLQYFSFCAEGHRKLVTDVFISFFPFLSSSWSLWASACLYVCMSVCLSSTKIWQWCEARFCPTNLLGRVKGEGKILIHGGWGGGDKVVNTII